jgi:hypothetical protein
MTDSEPDTELRLHPDDDASPAAGRVYVFKSHAPSHMQSRLRLEEEESAVVVTPDESVAKVSAAVARSGLCQGLRRRWYGLEIPVLDIPRVSRARHPYTESGKTPPLIRPEIL